VDELRKVVTPTREELVKLTGIVLVFVILMIMLVSLLDFLFGTGASFVFGDGSA
jgi:preprotein translocase subunit SecE